MSETHNGSSEGLSDLQNMISPSGHECMIYGGPPERHVNAIAAMIRNKLKLNNRCMYFNSPEIVQVFRWRLEALGVDVERELESGRLVLTSERPHLRNGAFDLTSMFGLLAEAFETTMSEGYAGLWTSGDIVWEFGPVQDYSMLLDYELKLDAFFSEHPEYGGVCQYHGASLPKGAIRDAVTSHPKIFLSDQLSIPNASCRNSEPSVMVRTE